MTTKTTGGKTPYEIRLEVLQMAKDHLEFTFKSQIDFATQAMAALTAANQASAKEFEALIPQIYTFDDIIKKATELYSFVQKRD